MAARRRRVNIILFKAEATLRIGIFVCKSSDTNCAHRQAFGAPSKLFLRQPYSHRGALLTQASLTHTGQPHLHKGASLTQGSLTHTEDPYSHKGATHTGSLTHTTHSGASLLTKVSLTRTREPYSHRGALRRGATREPNSSAPSRDP